MSGVAALPPSEGARVVKDNPVLGSLDSPEELVLAVKVRDADEAAQLSDLLTAARHVLLSHRVSTKNLLQTLIPSERLTVSGAYLEQVRRNASAQGALAEEFGLLASTEVARAAGSRADNQAALAFRWRKAARVFTVDAGGTTLYPGFQFDDHGQPRPVIARVLSAFEGRMDGWELALWFTGANDWLGGVRPVDVLDTSEAEVVNAAQQLRNELLG